MKYTVLGLTIVVFLALGCMAVAQAPDPSIPSTIPN